jgi:nucleoside-diphosphate kinase
VSRAAELESTVTSAVERTLVIVKPDAVQRGLVGQVLGRIESKGYRLTALDLRVATAEELAEHYAEHAGKPFYPGLIEFMASGPVCLAIAEGIRVVEGWRSLMGRTDPTEAAPGTIRGDLGRDWGAGSRENLVHGSDSVYSAEREIGIWFPGR